jgi:O-antigen ligase
VLIRAQTLELSRQLIRERPVTGWGLGHNLDEIRTDGRTEYMYWDLLMKLGIPGLLVFLALYAWTPVRSALRRTRFEPVITLGASLAGIAVTSYFNPYLNSTLGIVVLVMLVGAAAADREAAATDAPTQVT